MILTRRQLAGLSIGSSLIVALNSPALAADDAPAPAKPASAPAQNPLESAWANLGKDEPEAARGLLALTDRPQESVAFLKEHLSPLRITPERVKELIANLGSKDDAVWKPAFAEFEYFDPRLAIGLEALMDLAPDALTRPRLVAVLSERDPSTLEGKNVQLRKFQGGFNFFDGQGSWWAEADVKRINATNWGDSKKTWTRALRSIAFLEHLGTPEALSVIKRLSLGHEDARPTVEARAVLKRTAFKAK